jgi:hypothetical protein
MIRDYPNKRTLLIRANGEYSSASDSEDTHHTMLATDHAAKAEVHVNPGDADRYESLVAQRVLSTQVDDVLLLNIRNGGANIEEMACIGP